MVIHEFGGDWTKEKLDCLREYLSQYTKIFRKNLKAQYFTTTYVDAFAGTGYRSLTSEKKELELPIIDLQDNDREEYLKGSARVALEVDPPFHKYLFLEKNPQYIQELNSLKNKFPDKSQNITIIQTEANTYLKKWCAITNWNKNRALVFLDPYGMQVEWPTITAIANTKAIDLWLLFPLAIAVNRVLTKGKPPSGELAEILTRTFGTDEWKNRFYRTTKQQTLFGEEETECKQADFEIIGKFFIERLSQIFEKVAPNPLPLCNSRNIPLYLLCFAAGNPKGAPIAVKIASSILGRNKSRKQLWQLDPKLNGQK